MSKLKQHVGAEGLENASDERCFNDDAMTDEGRYPVESLDLQVNRTKEVATNGSKETKYGQDVDGLMIANCTLKRSSYDTVD